MSTSVSQQAPATQPIPSSSPSPGLAPIVSVAVAPTAQILASITTQSNSAKQTGTWDLLFGWINKKNATDLINDCAQLAFQGVLKKAVIPLSASVVNPTVKYIAAPAARLTHHIIQGVYSHALKPAATGVGNAIAQTQMGQSSINWAKSKWPKSATPSVTQKGNAFPAKPPIANTPSSTTSGGYGAAIKKWAISWGITAADFLADMFQPHTIDEEFLKKQKQQLQDITGSPFLGKTLKHMVPTILAGLKSKFDKMNKVDNSKNNAGSPQNNAANAASVQNDEKLYDIDLDKLANFQNLPPTLECLLITVFTNILKHIQQTSGLPPTPIQNPFQFVVSHIANRVSLYVKGDSTKNIEGIQHRLVIVENLKDAKQLSDLFAPLYKEFLNIALPDSRDPNSSIEDRLSALGFGDFLTWCLSWIDLQKPEGLVSLYHILIDPLCEGEKRKKKLSETPGGQVLLQITQLAAEEGTDLLLKLLGDVSGLVTDTLILPPAITAHRKPEEFLHQAEVIESRRRLTKDIAEIATTDASKDPSATFHETAMGEIQEFGGTMVSSIVSKVFINLATNNDPDWEKNLKSDPFPLVAKRLIDILKKFHKEKGVALKAQFTLLRQSYTEYNTKMKRLATLQEQGPNPDPIMEALRSQEIEGIKTWKSDWQSTPEQEKLVKDIFAPLATEILNATGMDKEDGFRLNLGDLNSIIQGSMALGFCELYRLAIYYFPGMMDWLDPDASVAEKTKQLDAATGNPAYSSLAKAFAPWITQNILPSIFEEKANSWAADMLFEINKALPKDLKLTKANDNYLQAITEGAFTNVAKRNPITDELWKFACLHVEETLLDLLLKNTSNPIDNPIIQVAMRCLYTFQTFQNAEGQQLAAAYAALPKDRDPTDDELKVIYDKYNKTLPGPNGTTVEKNLFETDLFDPLIEITALDKVINNGKLSVFFLDGKIRKNLSFGLFRLHAQITRHNPNPQEILNQLIAALGSQEQGTIAQQLSNFITDVIGTSAQPLVGQHSEAIAAALNGELFSQTPGNPSRDILKMCIETLAGQNSSMFSALWPIAKGFLNTGITQAIANLIDSTDPLMPRSPGEPLKWSLPGDLIARVSHIFADCMAKVAHSKAEVISLKAEIKHLKGIAGQETALNAAKNKLKDLYKSFTDAPIGLIRGNKDQDPLKTVPLSDNTRIKLWEETFPAMIGDLLIDFYDSATPDLQPMQDEINDIYGGESHVAEFVRYISYFTRDGTPIALRTKNDDIGNKIFASLEKLLKPYTDGHGKALNATLAKYKGTIQNMISHTMYQLGANMDRNGVMQQSVWPGLQQYSHSILLSLVLKFSRQMQSFEKNDPDNMLKFMTGMMQLVAKHFRKMNEITEKLRENSLYKVPGDKMTKLFGSYAHPAVSDSHKASSPEEIQEIHMKHVYVPFMKDVLEFIGYTAEDLPAPSFLKGPLFTLLSESLGPMSLELMVKMLFTGDGKEATIDKMESKVLDNMQAAMDAFTDYAVAALAKSKNSPQATDDQNKLTGNLLKQCADLVHELLQTPDWLSNQFVKMKFIKNMTAGQLADVIKQMCSDWPVTTIINRTAETLLPTMLGGGAWKGVGKTRRFVSKSYNVITEESEIVKQARLTEEENRARENKYRTARLVTDGLFTGAKIPFQILWKKIEEGIIWFCTKLFGLKCGTSIHRVILSACRHIGLLLSWILTPLYYLSWQILYGIMKIQSGFAHKNLKHPAHIDLIFKMITNLGHWVLEESRAIQAAKVGKVANVSSAAFAI